MKPADDIKKMIRKMDVIPSAEMDKRTLTDISKAQEKSQKTNSAKHQPNTWRIIMKTKITKLATAAVIITAVVIGINQLGGSIDGTNVAWGDVVTQVDRVENAHLYWFKSRSKDLIRDFEAWYAHGKLVIRKNGGVVYDDGETEQGFNEHGRLITKNPSRFAEGQTFFDFFTGGLLSERNEQFSQQIPTNVGNDFLIYELDWPDDDYIENVFITVGKNSLLPIQMKIYHKDGDYDLVMFDYEAPEKLSEFFEPPTVDTPNGRSEVVLDGEEVMIDIEGASGIKTAVVRLHGKYDGPSDQLPLDYRRILSRRFRKTYKKKGGPIFKLDVSFLTDEGYQSGTNDIIVARLNEAQKCGVGSSDGGLDNWPDGKYRNIKFSPLLRSTDRADTYIVEINCWLRPKDD